MDIYKRLLGYVKPYRWRLAIAFVCMLAYSLANSLVSVALYVITKGFVSKNQVIVDNIPFISNSPNKKDNKCEIFKFYWM